MTGKKCCILFNQPREGALADELDVMVQVDFVEAGLRELGIQTFRKGITADFMKEVSSLAVEKPDFVFNLVESIDNKGELCYFVPALLNMHSIPYSGSPVEAIFLTTSKILTARILEKAGISTPESYLPSQYGRLIAGSRYILKPVWEDGSLGITHDSVITFSSEQAEKIKSCSDTHWIIQDYIEGREFNITVIPGDGRPEVLPPAEMIFRDFPDDKPKIVDFKAKWEENSFEYINTVRSFPGRGLDHELDQRIRSAALDCWKEFGLRGYARIDMRVDNNNIPYVIEVNANPCLSPDGGVVAAVNEAGIPFTEILKRILSDLNMQR